MTEQHQAGRKRGRPRKETCRALIPLDTKKIRAEYLNVFKRRKKALEKLEAELLRYDENDEPEFQKFLARTFGAEQTRQRELAEQIGLCHARHEKIRFLAQEHRMSKERYCYCLSVKVTPEIDFWSVLEAELAAFQEADRKMREEEERSEFEEDAREFRDDDDGDCDYGEEEDDEEFAGDPDDVFKHIFGALFDEDEEPPPSESGERDVKKLYRELCLRYHPDKAGLHDAKTKRLWNEIQEAYHSRDLARLRSIHAGAALESQKTELVCSEIGEMIFDLDWRIRETRSELRIRKQTPFWGFSSWTENRKKQASKEIRFEFERDLQATGRQLRQMEAELERLLRAWKPKRQPVSTPKRKARAEWREEMGAEIPDLFDFDA